jgi:hypothetical protein
MDRAFLVLTTAAFPFRRGPRRKAAALLTLLGTLSCSEGSLNTEPSFKPGGVAAREVIIDFSSFGVAAPFDPDFYRSDGIRFPPQRCGSAGCDTWSVELIQGDAALLGEPVLRGPVQATFTRPISDLSLRVAPALQGTATYVLKAFALSGKVIATTSITVTQDIGDPANTGSGYFTISLSELPLPAQSFTLDNVFVRSSFPLNTLIPYGVSSISYTHWDGRP